MIYKIQGKIDQEVKLEIQEVLFYDICRKRKRIGMFY